MKRLAYLFAVLSLGLPSPRPGFAQTPDHTGPVIEPVPLGVLVRESTAILVLQVDQVLPEKDLVVFKSAAVLSGEAVPGPPSRG